MSPKDDIKKLINEHQRRLQKRKEQEAALGIATSPEILTEIENIEAKIEQLQAQLAALEDANGDEKSQSTATPPPNQTPTRK